MIYLMRHGQLPPNPERRFVGSRNIPLAKEGHLQAQRWAKELQNNNIQHIVTSPLERCVETATIISQKLHAPITLVPAFQEISLGSWEGLTPDEVRTCYPQQWEERGKHLDIFRPEGGESFTDVAKRALPVFAQWHASKHAPVLIIAHVGVNRVILAHLLALPLRKLMCIPQPYACLNRIL